MGIAEILSPDRIVIDVRIRDKAHLITEIARQFARAIPHLQAETIEAALLARERLGSTGLGGGFALPHARIEGLDHYLGLFLRLAKPIAFDAIDGGPVTMVFALLTPADGANHVSTLAAISRRFRDIRFVTSLRRTKTQNEAFGLLTNN